MQSDHEYFQKPGGKKQAKIFLLFFTILAIHLQPAAGASPAESPPPLPPAIDQEAIENILAPKSMTRKYDAAIVTGGQLSSLMGKEISQLRLYAYTSGRMQPIPYQIDERDPTGEFVFSGGSVAGQDIDNGKFDANDELVFVSGHSGDRVAPRLWPEGSTAGHEIVLADPREPEKKAWAYLLYFPKDPPPPSEEDYVSYDPENDRVVGKYYTVGYRKGYALFTDLSYPEISGGNGKDFLDRIKMRMDVQMLKGLVHVRRKESDIRCKVIGWKEGPIRVLRNTEMYFRILFDIPSPSLFSVTEYYPNYFSVPMRFTVPFNLKWVMNSFVISGFGFQMYGDFLSHMVGGTGVNRGEAILITGNTPEKEIRATHPDLTRMDSGLFKKEGVGAWCARMAFPDCFLQYFNIYIKDDLNSPNPPEDEPGEIAMGAFVYSKSLQKKMGLPDGRGIGSDAWNSINKGSFELSLDTYIASPATTKEQWNEWLAIRDYPLQVEVAGSDTQSAMMIGETNPELIKAVLFDRQGRQINLRDLVFHVGSPRTTSWDAVIGYQLEEEKWHTVPLEKIRRIDFRIEDLEPKTGISRPLFIKVTRKDGTIIDLFHAKTASFAGHIDEDETIFMWNPMIERIEMRD